MVYVTWIFLSCFNGHPLCEDCHEIFIWKTTNLLLILTRLYKLLFYLQLSADQLPWAHCPQDNGTAEAECTKASATVYYWYREALDASPSIEQPGAPRWWIVLYLLLAWIIVFFIVMKGIQSSGKVFIYIKFPIYYKLTIGFNVINNRTDKDALRYPFQFSLIQNYHRIVFIKISFMTSFR